jgi:hypothetical protein
MEGLQLIIIIIMTVTIPMWPTYWKLELPLELTVG